MAKYSGKELVAELGTIVLSGQYTSCEWKASEGEPDRIDVSDKSSYSGGRKEYVTGLRGDLKMTGTIKGNDVAGGSSTLADLNLGDTGTLVIYPEGKTHTYPKYTIASIVVNDIQFSTGYASKTEWSVGWYGYTEVADGTYSSV